MKLWANTEARKLVSCPRCGAAPEEHCRTPKGRQAHIHNERCKLYRDTIGPEEFARRHVIRVEGPAPALEIGSESPLFPMDHIDHNNC